MIVATKEAVKLDKTKCCWFCWTPCIIYGFTHTDNQSDANYLITMWYIPPFWGQSDFQFIFAALSEFCRIQGYIQITCEFSVSSSQTLEENSFKSNKQYQLSYDISWSFAWNSPLFVFQAGLKKLAKKWKKSNQEILS